MSRKAWTNHLARKASPGAARSTSRAPQDSRLRPRPRRKRIIPEIETVDAPEVQIHDMLIVGKPRMTQRDKWMRRDVVMRYRAMKDEIRIRGVQIPDAFVAVIYLPMPKSWPAAYKLEMNGTKHQVRPDHDNASKALSDCGRLQDQRIHDGRAIKRWAYRPRLVIVNTEKRGQPTPEEIAQWLPPKETAST